MRDVQWTARRPRWTDPGVAAAVGIAASAGGFAALEQILSDLPARFTAPLLLATHRAGDPAQFCELISRRTGFHAEPAIEGRVPTAGTVYVPPVGRHLSVASDGTLCVCRSERLRYVRPSADFLFATMADSFADRAVGVVLSGVGADGARGVQAMRAAGGYVICQSVATAEYPSMPRAAIDTGSVDVVLPLQTIGFALSQIVGALSEQA